MITCTQTVLANAYGQHWKLIPQTLYQPVETFQLTVLFLCLRLVLRKFHHDTYIYFRMQHYFRFQHIIIFCIFPACPFVMDAVQTFPIRFLPAAVQLRPVYDDLSVFILYPGLFKCSAAQQPFYQPAYRILQFLRGDSLKVIIDGFPV